MAKSQYLGLVNTQNETLKIRWQQCFAGADETNVAEEFSRLVTHYGEAHRHYHTLAHINACLSWLDQVSNLVEDKQALELAFWFHDVIYDPKRSDNEEQSAQYARGVLPSLGIVQEQVDKVAHLILLTKHPANPSTNDEKYLLDIDLAILGSEPSIYRQYEQWILSEYSHVPDDLYRYGRRGVLAGFLGESPVYETEFFHERLENRALNNIKMAL